MFPKLISYGDWFLPAYGVLVALGFLAGLWMAARLGRRAGLNPDDITPLGVNSAIAGLVGAKLLMLAADADYYWRNPGEIFSLSTLQAGGIFFGGLVLALGFAGWQLRRKRMPVLTTLDCFAPAIALGHAIGRLGCYAAGCCWGALCERPWAVTFTDPEAHRLVGVPLNVPLHPTQLYEAAAQFAVFAVTHRYIHARPAPGRVIALYLMLASAARFGIDFLRAHDQPNPWGGPLSTAQWIAVLLAATGAWLWLRTRGPGAPAAQRLTKAQ